MSHRLNQKRAAILGAIDDVNPLKSRLMDITSRLRTAEANAQADSLDRIIARLEVWQARVRP